MIKRPGRALVVLCLSGLLLYGLISAATSGNAAGRVRSAASQQRAGTTPDGAALDRGRCAACHDNPTDRVPSRATIAGQSLDVVVESMTRGVMKPQAAGLSVAEIRAIATYLTMKDPGAATEAKTVANFCAASGGPINFNGPQWNGWGRDLDNSRYQPNPGLKAEDVPKLKLKWAFGYPGAKTWGQPTIIGDRLYVTSSTGMVYCLNAQTGCTYWQLNLQARSRTAISIGPLPAGAKARFAAYFGDHTMFVHAVDAETGKPLWKTKVDEHLMARLTGAPVLYQDRLYVPVSSIEEGPAADEKYECCKFRGALVALDAYTGKLLWKTHTIQEPLVPFKKNAAGTQQYGPAGAAIWSSPTLDQKRKVLYAATGNSYTDVDTKGADAIIAFDMNTGEIVWSNQITAKDNFLVNCWPKPTGNCPTQPGPDVDFGSSPILRPLANGKHVILPGQKSGDVYALDPDNKGKILWQAKVGEGGALGGVQWGHAADDQNVYVAISDVVPIGKRTPGLAALKIATGERVWHAPTPKPVCAWGTGKCEAAQSAAVTVIPGVAFSGAMDGHLRAYSTKDGSIIWDFDTAAKPYATVNGVKATGGSLDVGGPAIAGGMLFVNSGYGVFFGQSGNVLLAFSVEGR